MNQRTLPHEPMQLCQRRDVMKKQCTQCEVFLTGSDEEPFRHKKGRCKGLAKNKAWWFGRFGLANLTIAKRPLLAIHARGAS